MLYSSGCCSWCNIGSQLVIVCLIFERLELIVHPAFDFCIGAFTAMVNFCSHAYRADVVSEHLLHRQVSRAQENVESRLEITLADAQVFQQSYFPQAHTYGSNAPSKSRVEIFADCNLSWARLLRKMFTIAQSTIATWPSSQLVDALLSIIPQTFDNAVLHLLSKVPVSFCTNFTLIMSQLYISMVFPATLIHMTSWDRN